jgi:hypothetical protein
MAVTETGLDEPSIKKEFRTVHIDTSLQIERCKALRKAQIVEEALQAFPFKSTSSYAKLEFKRAWLQRLLYLYSDSHQISRMNELLGFVTDRLGSHPKHRRRLITCLQAIESFLSRINESLSPTAKLIRFRSHIRHAIIGAYTWWASSITHEYDGTGCVRAAEQPRQLAGEKIDVSIPQCRRNKIKCTIHQFFERNKEHFTAIKVEIEARGDNVSKELQEAKKIIEDAEKDPEYLCDDRNCLKLGDALIAMDGLDIDYFAANNDKEWALLSKVLGKNLINPVKQAKTE